MNYQLYMTLLDGLNEIPLLDVHTHLDASHLTARGLHDIALYHMVISDLVSAGCPSRGRLSEDPGDDEVETRMEEAIPFLNAIQNTSMSWGMRMILADLYGWREPITLENWRKLDGLIRERAEDGSWAGQILRKTGIRRASTELWRRRDGSQDCRLQYSLEWAFFTRSQWGVYDIPLFELERAWNQEGPGAPLPVTLGEERQKLERSIRNLEDVHAAIEHYVSHIPYADIISTAQHISTDIHYWQVSDDEMVDALERREWAGPIERDVYAGYILEAFLGELESHAESLVYHFSIGAEPLPFETGSKLRQETIFELAVIIERHPRLRFQALLSSEHANQAMCTLARELPNLSLAGYWWHNFFPGVMRKVISERLDMLAVNKQVGFFSDAYCLDWAYAKAALIRRQWAEVLAQKVEQGQYSIEQALEIAHQVFYESAKTLLGMKEGDGA
jgi:glucuronate isomerase